MLGWVRNKHTAFPNEDFRRKRPTLVDTVFNQAPLLRHGIASMNKESRK